MGCSKTEAHASPSQVPSSRATRKLDQRFSLINLKTASNHPTDFSAEVRRGLSKSAKCLPPRFLYDQEGSRLFEAICELPEYYLTRAEKEILETNAERLAAEFPDRCTIIELGSGSASKTRTVIEAFLRRCGELRYIPIDISKSMLEQSSRNLLSEYPGLEVVAIAGEYSDALAHLPEERGNPKLFLWLGSNISNLDRPAAVTFLAAVRRRMTLSDRMLVGIDLRKEPQTLMAAYNDPAGVTAQFNLNVLARVNRELGGRFDLKKFHHEAIYNEEAGRIEMYLVSEKAQEVRVETLGARFRFAQGERIHTENSYKYSREEIEELALAAGLKPKQQWFDVKYRFSENLLVTG